MTGTPTRTLHLAALVAPLAARAHGELDREISSVVCDTRAVRPGSLFVALRGTRTDGHEYAAAALASGAAAIVVDERHAAGRAFEPGAAVLVVAQTRLALSRAAALLNGDPSAEVRCIGVTGTNGKTTTTHVLAALLEAGGIATGTIGTLGASFGVRTWPLENTTPLANELQSLLAQMRDDGARAVAMEVSSHALALDRVADVAFAIAVLTNVTRDHLDFHETFEAYAASKRSLFDRTRSAVFNIDDPLGRAWARELATAGVAVTTYGFATDADLRAEDVVRSVRGSRFRVGDLDVALPLPGAFNVSNALAALAVARLCGVPDAASVAALREVPAIPGRMERVEGGGVSVFVDYAHTPDALERVLGAARDAARGAVTVVFGCGGDRDRGKRPEMGRLAEAGADSVIVTSDNPRGEDPQAIARAILAGIADASRVRVELDRARAIGLAIAGASPGDVVVVAGKGHETYQIVGDEVRHFDDRACARDALAAREPA